MFCWPRGWKISSHLEASVGSSWLAGLDFPLSHQVLATPDYVISPWRQVQNPKLRAWCCSQCLETKHFPNLFSPGTTPSWGGCGSKCQHQEHHWGWGSSQCQGHLPLPSDLCVMALPVVSVLLEPHLPTWKEFLGPFSVSLETESREKVIGVSTLLSNF